MPSSDFPAISSDESIESPILLVILSDTESDPSKDSPSSDHALVAPDVSPFLSDDHSESEPLEDSSEEDAPKPYEATVSCWRAAVMTHSSSSSSSASTPLASFQLVLASPSLPRRPGQEIPFGRPYCTHHNEVLRMLTAWKRVHPFPARIPANRRRFCYVSSSSSPLPRKRRRVLPHSSLSGSLSSLSFVAPSRKRCRSPTADLIRANLLPLVRG
ncbi:hypothetical protein Tco_0924668 [Tanacetum coccineum]|uniref:Uncharacterized protein n=1 Tax=Tanacetum coccineum TaxID=301880 RepID=A0ABQ5D5L1_9ASTR